MDSKRIELLLEKYWNCETSLEEEQQLREYFSKEDFPGQWKDTSELFRYFEHQKKDLADLSFDAEVMKKVRQASPQGKVTRLIYNVARIAAGLLVVAVATFLVRQEIRKSYPPEVADTYSDPKLAFEETKKALMMISRGLGRAQTETKKINLLNEAEQKIEGKKDDKKEKSNI